MVPCDPFWARQEVAKMQRAKRTPDKRNAYADKRDTDMNTPFSGSAHGLNNVSNSCLLSALISCIQYAVKSFCKRLHALPWLFSSTLCEFQLQTRDFWRLRLKPNEASEDTDGQQDLTERGHQRRGGRRFGHGSDPHCPAYFTGYQREDRGASSGVHCRLAGGCRAPHVYQRSVCSAEAWRIPRIQLRLS